MGAADVVHLGAAKVNDGGIPVVQATIPVSDDSNDDEPFGEIEMFQCLGVTAIPFPKDDKGYAEGVVMRNCGGRDAVLVGARDTRTAAMVGKAKGGDTIVHSTGPNQAAQIQLKETRRQVVIVTKDDSGEGIILNLDGNGKVVQVMAGGAAIQLSAGEVTITNGDASIVMQGKTIALCGQVILGGLTPNPAMRLHMGPPTPSPGGPAALPTMPVPGVFIGT